MKKIQLITLCMLFTALLYGESFYIDEAQGDYSLEDGLSLIDKWKGEADTELARGIVYHNICSFDLNPEWIEESISLLTTVYEETNNPLALGYLGSAITLKAGYQYEINQIMKSVSSLDEGAKKIDQAISMDKEDISLRFLRLINAIEVSETSPVSRDQVILEDLDYIRKELEKLDSEEQSLYYYYKGRYLLNRDNIEEGILCLEKSIRKSSDTSSAKLARELLLVWEE